MGNAFGTKHDTSLSLAFISELKVTNQLINLHHKTHTWDWAEVQAARSKNSTK
jgi:hypothetical protein